MLEAGDRCAGGLAAEFGRATDPGWLRAITALQYWAPASVRSSCSGRRVGVAERRPVRWRWQRRRGGLARQARMASTIVRCLCAVPGDASKTTLLAASQEVELAEVMDDRLWMCAER